MVEPVKEKVEEKIEAKAEIKAAKKEKAKKEAKEEAEETIPADKNLKKTVKEEETKVTGIDSNGQPVEEFKPKATKDEEDEAPALAS